MRESSLVILVTDIFFDNYEKRKNKHVLETKRPTVKTTPKANGNRSRNNKVNVRNNTNRKKVIKRVNITRAKNKRNRK